LVAPPRGIGRAYEDTESLPSPTVKKGMSITNLFRRGVGGSRPNSRDAEDPVVADVSERRLSKSGSIVSGRTGKEKRFQGLRKLFRIKE